MSSQSQNRRRRTTVRSAVSWLAFAASATAQRVVPVGFSKTNTPTGLSRRASFSTTLINEKSAYFAKVQVGTPAQTVTLHVDTGSSDLWLLSETADLCNSITLQQEWGQCVDTFDASKSSTFEVVGDGDFKITYVDETGASGDYFTDNVSLGGGKTITGLQMGLARKSTSNWGMLGIGMPGALSSATEYPNIIDMMYNQKLISTKAYSLYLDDYSAESGTILFGGLDTDKFHGTLLTMPIVGNNVTGEVVYDHFTVPVTTITAVGPQQNTSLFSNTASVSNEPLYVILDSGTSLTYLPSTVTNSLFKLLNTYDDTSSRGSGQILVDCDLRQKSGLTISFQFNGPNGPVINVPATEFILDDLKSYISSGAIAVPSNLPWSKDRVCRMGIMPGDEQAPTYLIGDTFLRSAYVVYDLTNHEIGMAQSNVDSDSSKVVEIVDGIPAATGVPYKAKTNAGAGRTKKGWGGMAVGVAAVVGTLTLFGF